MAERGAVGETPPQGVSPYTRCGPVPREPTCVVLLEALSRNSTLGLHFGAGVRDAALEHPSPSSGSLGPRDHLLADRGLPFLEVGLPPPVRFARGGWPFTNAAPDGALSMVGACRGAFKSATSACPDATGRCPGSRMPFMRIENLSIFIKVADEEDPLATGVNREVLDGRERLVAYYIADAIETPDEEKRVPTTAEEDTFTTSEIKRRCEAIDWSKQLIRDLRSLYEAGLIVAAKQTFTWEDDDAKRDPRAFQLADDIDVEFIELVSVTPSEYWDIHGENDPETAEEAIEAVRQLQSRVDELEDELQDAKAVKEGALKMAKEAKQALEEAADADDVDELEERVNEMEDRLDKHRAAIEDPDAFFRR